MADPVAIVERIVKIGLKIKKTMDTVRHNKEVCQEINKSVLRSSNILSQLQRTGVMDNSTAMSGALEDLEETLEHALKLVGACQERSAIGQHIAAGDLANQLGKVKDDILHKVMMASFSIQTHTTIVLTKMHTSGHLLSQKGQDTGVVKISHNSHSTDGDTRSELNGKEDILRGSEVPFAPLVEALIEFSFSELEAATNGFSDKNIIGQGGFATVYKGVLNNGSTVAIKKYHKEPLFGWPQTCDQLLLVSYLQHKNIIKVLGYGHKGMVHQKSEDKPIVAWLKERINRNREMGYDSFPSSEEYVYVEEYVPNGTLHGIIHYQGMFSLKDRS